MIPLLATSPQANLLWVLGSGFVLIGSYFFGRLVTFFFPNNPLIRKGKKEETEEQKGFQEKPPVKKLARIIAFLHPFFFGLAEMPIGGLGSALQASYSQRNLLFRHNSSMPRVKLNPETEEVGKTFKVIAISLIVVLNVIVFTWFFFFSGLSK